MVLSGQLTLDKRQEKNMLSPHRQPIETSGNCDFTTMLLAKYTRLLFILLLLLPAGNDSRCSLKVYLHTHTPRSCHGYPAD